MFSGMPAVFTGMLQGEELSQAYASGDVFVMPSESETLGLVVLEAMSSGVPVVGARAGESQISFLGMMRERLVFSIILEILRTA